MQSSRRFLLAELVKNGKELACGRWLFFYVTIALDVVIMLSPLSANIYP